MTGDGDREALRRRLYEPGASDADVAAYAATSEPPVVDDAPLPVRRPFPHRRAAGAAALLVAVVAISGALALRPGGRAAAPRRTATAQVAEVGTTAPERIAFIRALTEGGSAGVSTWLDAHARALPGVLATATRSDTSQFTGDGTRRLMLDPPSVGDDGGHVTVLVVAAVEARVSWTLLGDGPDPAWGAVAGTASAAQEAGALTSASVSYAPGRRPGRLLVVAPDGVRWTTAVVFSQ